MPRRAVERSAITFPTIVVAAGQGARAPVDEAAVIAHVKDRLAGYKAPKRVLFVASLERRENGKVDHRHWKRRATELLAK